MNEESETITILIKQSKYILQVVDGFSIEIYSTPPSKFHRWMISKMLGFKFILPDNNGNFNTLEDD